jgi:Uncharacterised nucleotidyltransferase
VDPGDDVRPEVAAVANNLRLDNATAEVLNGFAARGVHALVLKGPSVVRWLYDEGERRPYVDCDLLVRPGDLEAAQAAMRALGFEPDLEEAEMPDWWRFHAVLWRREADGVMLDLHRTLAGVRADPARVWSALAADEEPLVVAGVEARVPSPAARLFHLALHAASHGSYGAARADLERALERIDTPVWRAAAALAESLDSTAVFAAGLRSVAEGERLAAELGLPRELPVDAALNAASAPAAAFAFEQISRAGVPGAVRMAGARLFPPPTFMRAWSPLARRGALGLAVAYAWRPLWCATQVPGGLRAWRSARRLARRADRDLQ